MKQTLILTILIGILLFAATALAGENCLAGDTVRVAAVTLHTNDARLAYLLNGGRRLRDVQGSGYPLLDDAS